MICENCKTELGEPDKHKVINCQCGAQLMLIEIKKVKQLMLVGADINGTDIKTIQRSYNGMFEEE